MTDRIILRIRGVADDLGYTVGMEGVTKIVAGSYSPEPHCERIFYQIYKGDKLFSVVNDPAVAEVTFSAQ